MTTRIICDRCRKEIGLGQGRFRLCCSDGSENSPLEADLCRSCKRELEEKFLWPKTEKE